MATPNACAPKSDKKSIIIAYPELFSDKLNMFRYLIELFVDNTSKIQNKIL